MQTFGSYFVEKLSIIVQNWTQRWFLQHLLKYYREQLNITENSLLNINLVSFYTFNK